MGAANRRWCVWVRVGVALDDDNDANGIRTIVSYELESVGEENRQLAGGRGGGEELKSRTC